MSLLLPILSCISSVLLGVFFIKYLTIHPMKMGIYLFLSCLSLYSIIVILFNILEGMRNSIKKFRPAIQMEVHTRILGYEKTQKLLEWFISEKYEVVYYITRQLDCPTVGNMDDVKHFSITDILNLLTKNKLPSAFLLFLKPKL